MANFMNHHVAKACQNRNNSLIMSWWKSNFNMPTPDIGDNTVWLVGYGPVAYDGAATSFDLSGFYPGWEVVAFFTIWHWDGPLAGTAYLYSRWVDTAGATIFNCQNGTAYVFDIAVGLYGEYWAGCNQGIASWEIDTSGDFGVKSHSTGTGAMGEQTTTITFSNVPSTTQLASDKPGYIWVEGNNLNFINANRWEHIIIGTDQGYVDTAKAGYMWVDTSDDLHWIGVDGHDYIVPWKIQEFASTWSNSSNDATAPGTSYKGYTWVDNEYGWTHLAYIGNNGHKFLVGSGHYPYVLSY